MSKPPVILLAGGQGTRIRHLFPDVPKCMIPIEGRPFIDYLLENLYAQGFRTFYFALGYKALSIQDHVSRTFQVPQSNLGTIIEFRTELQPLGTGGAVRAVFSHYGLDKAWVINADTYPDYRLPDLDSTTYIRSLSSGQDTGCIFCEKGFLGLRDTGSIHEFINQTPDTYETNGDFYDIGTPEGLERFRQFIKNRKSAP